MVLCRRRDATLRFSSIVSYCFQRLFLAWFSVLSRCHYERRHNAGRRFSSAVSCGFPGLMFAKWNLESTSRRYASRHLASVCQSRVLWFVRLMFAASGILSRPRDYRRWESQRQFAIVLSCGFPGLRHALYGILSRCGDDRRRDGPRRFASVVSCGFSSFVYIIYGILSRRCDARRQFANVLSCSFTKLMYALYGIFCRRLDARCRVLSIVSYGVSMLLAWFGIEVGVATVSVATLSVGSIMCRRASRGSSTVRIWNILSASVFLRRVLCHSLAHLRKIWSLVSASQRLSLGLSSWVRMCRVVSSRGSRIVECCRGNYP
jgi:hypothetical protein